MAAYSEPIISVPQFGAFRSTDLDEVIAFYADERGIRMLVEPAPDVLPFAFDAHPTQLGPFHAAEHALAADPALRSDRYDVYIVGVAVARSATTPTNAVADRSTNGSCISRAGPNGQVPVFMIDRRALEDHLAAALDRLICEHPDREAVRHPLPPCRPRVVKHAIDAIHANPDQPHTAGTLAKLSGVSVRTLQVGFRRYVGMPPMAYLRHVRLTHAHDDLRTGKVRSVAQAAHRWGFTHLGRFAAAYQAKYGAAPSVTLSIGKKSAGSGNARAPQAVAA